MRKEGGQQPENDLENTYVTRYLRSELEKKKEQDQVNNANSAFIFMINLFIIQCCHSGSVGQIGQICLVSLVV